MFNGIQGYKDIANRFKREVDYVIERGVSGIWTYKKYASGEFEIRGGSMFSFGDGYSEIYLPPEVRFRVVRASVAD